MDSIVPDIKAKLNIVDVVGGYLRLVKAGTHWKAPCPFHNEKTPSFMVNEERQIWHCFGCGKGGDMFSFVEEIEGIDFREALKLLAEKAGVELPKYRRDSALGSSGVEEPDRSREILELATKFYEKQLHDGEGKKSALPYLKRRGLSGESIRTFRLGYAPEGWRHLSDFLVSRGYRPDELEKAGLVIRKDGGTGHYDRFRDRIMFPITDIVGRIIGYSARVTPGGDESQAKYINTPETAAYRKSRVLYGIYQAKAAMKDAEATILVEGNMDVIAMHQSGAKNTVAVSGTALTPEHVEILRRYGGEIRLFFDMDGAGQTAAWKSALLGLEKELSVSIIALPKGKDAAEAALESPEALRNAIDHPVPAAEYFLARFLGRFDSKTPEGKRKIAESFAPLLLSMRNPIERSYWQKELSSRIGVEERVLSGVLHAGTSPGDRFERKKEVSEESPEPFLRRSEVLRNRILGLLFLKGFPTADEALPDAARPFLSKDPLFSVLENAGGKDAFSDISDEDEKRRATKLLFEAEQAYGAGENRDDDTTAGKPGMRDELVSELLSELRKEERIRIAADIDRAQKNGDREESRRLMGRLSELSKD